MNDGLYLGMYFRVFNDLNDFRWPSTVWCGYLDNCKVERGLSDVLRTDNNGPEHLRDCFIGWCRNNGTFIN